MNEEFQRKCFDHLHELPRERTDDRHRVSRARDHREPVQPGGVARSREVAGRRRKARSSCASTSTPSTRKTSHPSGGLGAKTSGKVRLGSGEVRVNRLEYLERGESGRPVLLSGEPATFSHALRSGVAGGRPGLRPRLRHESGVTSRRPELLGAAVRSPRASPARGYATSACVSSPCCRGRPISRRLDRP